MVGVSKMSIEASVLNYFSYHNIKSIDDFMAKFEPLEALAVLQQSSLGTAIFFHVPSFVRVYGVKFSINLAHGKAVSCLMVTFPDLFLGHY